MSKSLKFFWILFGVYFLLAEISTLIADYYQNDLGFLISMKGYIPLMKYWALLGLILYTISYIIVRVNQKNRSKDLEYLKAEKRELKAKLFDLQEEINQLKQSAILPTTDIPGIEQDKPMKEK